MLFRSLFNVMRNTFFYPSIDAVIGELEVN
jgi:hypothetical protein